MSIIIFIYFMEWFCFRTFKNLLIFTFLILSLLISLKITDKKIVCKFEMLKHKLFIRKILI